jgi:hypothetical protein
MPDCLHRIYLGMYEVAHRAVANRDYAALSQLELTSGGEDPMVCRASLMALNDAMMHLPARGATHLVRGLGQPCCDRHVPRTN